MNKLIREYKSVLLMLSSGMFYATRRRCLLERKLEIEKEFSKIYGKSIKDVVDIDEVISV